MVTPLLRSRPAAGAAASGLYVARRTGAEIFLPAPPPATVTGGAAGWTFGAWVSLGTPSNDLILSGISVTTAGLVGNMSGVIELAYGGSYTALDATRNVVPFFNPGPTTLFFSSLSTVSRPVTVPAGETLYARAAQSAAGAVAFGVFVVGWDSALPTWEELAANVAAGPGRYYPSNVNPGGLAVMSGAGWAYGASSTVVDPAPNDMLAYQILTAGSIGDLLDTATLFQLGFGASGAETWCATVPHAHEYLTQLIHPPVLVRSGERLAVRSADAAAQPTGVLVKVYDL